MICSQCQAMNDSESMFCSNCGTSLTRSVPGPGAPGPRPQSTVLTGYGPQASRAADDYHPADEYAQDARRGPYAPRHHSPPSDPSGQYPSSTPTSQFSPDPLGNRYPPGAPAPRAHAPAQTFHLDLRRLSRVDQTVGGASLVVLISLFLPWFGVTVLGSTATISGTSTHGYLVLDVIVAIVLIAYLVLRSGWDELPVNLPVAHAPILLIGTGLQFLLVVIGFLDVPSGLSWEIGAYLALIGSVAAAGPVIIPAIRSWQASR